ncbi:hypothetical protein EJ05DRAFT_279015 [Pseudovirgaria hyperparasitica]|uniref:Uncharacterized protein n=1 Tax=Pseudovirgaria hyperparasitica TaxID=470096 RepID=A0A6A6WC69_9PEZI|nr:uncharacterized protein EJ05DRAFT_279015 [Pseudovirgaria hyperparasitica]KAF2760303.1 hypothetical protein EJ05DRAFT_279015 [Pseudovirgaria hyperparasitica]
MRIQQPSDGMNMDEDRPNSSHRAFYSILTASVSGAGKPAISAIWGLLSCIHVHDSKWIESSVPRPNICTARSTWSQRHKGGMDGMSSSIAAACLPRHTKTMDDGILLLRVHTIGHDRRADLKQPSHWRAARLEGTK